MMEKIVAVCGGTGRQGGAVVHEMLNYPDWQVFALSRNPDGKKARSLAQQGVAVRGADLGDKSSLVAAFDGARFVFGVTQPWSGDYKKCHPEAEIQQGRNIVEACLETGVGHLVMSTVHTPDAAKTISRLMALFPPEEQDLVRQRLADNLRATISQRLLPKTDGKGRVAALEIMVVTGTVQEWLMEMNKPSTIRDIIEKSRDQYGMQSFDQCLTDLFKGGLVSLDVAKSAASHPADFVRALHFEG